MIEKSYFYVLFSMLLAILIVGIGYTGMPIIIQPLGKELALSFLQIQWVSISYLLTFSVSIVIAAKIGDVYGNKKILVLGLAAFGIASSISGVSHLYNELIVSRLMQGLAAGMILPNATAVILKSASEGKKHFSLGMLTGVVGISMTVGPAIAGFLVNYFSWRWFFSIDAPLSILILISVYICPKIKKTATAKHVDIVGFMLFTIPLCLFIIAILTTSQIAHRWWVTFLLLSTSIILFVLFFISEKKTKAPLFDISILTNRPFLLGCALRILTNLSFYSFIYIISLYLNNNIGFSLIKSGLLLFPMSLVVGITAATSGHLIKKHGELPFVVTSCICLSMLYLIFSFAHNMSAYQIMLLLIIPGLCYGLLSSALVILALKKVKKEHSGIAAGMFYMSTLIGSLLGVILSTTIVRNNTIYKISQTNFIHVLLMCSLFTLVALMVIVATKVLSYRGNINEFSSLQGNWQQK